MKDITLDIIAGKIKSVEPDGILEYITFKLSFEEPVEEGSKLKELPGNTASVEAYRHGMQNKPDSTAFYVGGIRAIEKTGLAMAAVQYVKSFKYRNNEPAT